MADRNVREPDRALAQRLARLEDRLRALSLRAWPGAVRTAMEDEVTPTEPDAETALVSITAVAGRWVVFGHCRLYMAEAAGYNLTVTLSATDPTSGAVLGGSDPDTGTMFGGPDFEFPYWQARMCNYLSPVVESAGTTGHFVTDDVVTVTMSAHSWGGEAYTATMACLLLMPV